MEGDMTNIYGSSAGSLIGSVIGYFIGLLVLVGGFIFAARFLIGRRVERFEREWRREHGAPERSPDDRPADEEKKPNDW